MAEPSSRDGSIEVLELDGPAPADAEIAISAVPLGSGKTQDAKSFLREALDQELFRGVEELRGLSKSNMGGHQFYFYETRRGVEQHMLVATTLEGYILQIVLAAHDEKMLKQLEASFEHVVFFSPSEMQQYLAAGAKPYDGPSTSSHQMALLLADPPIGHLDQGKVRGDFYENAQLGFSYRIPQGWVLEAEGAVIPAVERSRTRENFGRPLLAPGEKQLIGACTKTLFSAWQKRPSSDGQISYDDFGEVTVSATSLACFPNMKFPDSAEDKRGFKDFLLQFGLTHPILNDMRDGRAFNAGGSIFLFLHGTVAFSIPDDELSRRLSIALAVTQRRGYLLTWFFAAPHDSELKALTDERVSFDPDTPPASVANVTQPGGGVASGANETPASSATTAAPAAPATSAPAAAPASETSAPADTAATSDAGAAAPASSAPPSLLRPGETMESQQGKGAPIKKK